MSKVITFSRTFPAYHPKAGQPTYFVEKMHKSPDVLSPESVIYNKDIFNFAVYNDCLPKLHTIRAGERWKKGDKFSPRVWSGEPYKSKQITIAPDIEIKWTRYFEIADEYVYLGDLGKFSKAVDYKTLADIAKNDGLSVVDFQGWFKWPRPFEGQIISWDESVSY